MTNLPEPGGQQPGGPGRRLSNRDFELVIRRAAELQAKESEDLSGDGIDEAEALRIGRELGLSTQHLHRALVEVSGDAQAESGLMVKLFGPGRVTVGRTVRGTASEVALILERHLVEREYLAVLRRLPDRVLYTRATGVGATVGRAMSQAFNRSPLLPVSNLDVSVHALEEGFAYVTLTSMLRKERIATSASSMVGGGTGTVVAGASLAIAIAPPAALLALPILGASVFAGHAYYSNLVEKVQVQLEFLLDRLEHGELVRPVRPKSLPWG